MLSYKIPIVWLLKVYNTTAHKNYLMQTFDPKLFVFLLVLQLNNYIKDNTGFYHLSSTV